MGNNTLPHCRECSGRGRCRECSRGTVPLQGVLRVLPGARLELPEPWRAPSRCFLRHQTLTPTPESRLKVTDDDGNQQNECRVRGVRARRVSRAPVLSGDPRVLQLQGVCSRWEHQAAPSVAPNGAGPAPGATADSAGPSAAVRRGRGTGRPLPSGYGGVWCGRSRVSTSRSRLPGRLRAETGGRTRHTAEAPKEETGKQRGFEANSWSLRHVAGSRQLGLFRTVSWPWPRGKAQKLHAGHGDVRDRVRSGCGPGHSSQLCRPSASGASGRIPHPKDGAAPETSSAGGWHVWGPGGPGSVPGSSPP